MRKRTVRAPVEELRRLGAQIRTARIAQDLAQDDLAERLNMCQAQVSQIERGICPTKSAYIACLAVLHLPLPAAG